MKKDSKNNNKKNDSKTKNFNNSNKSNLNKNNLTKSNLSKNNSSNDNLKKESKIVSAVIEDKKVSDVKEKIVKKQINDKKAFFLIGFAVILLLILFYSLFFYNPYKYSFVINDVPYNSNYFTPNGFFNVIKNESEVFVSPALNEKDVSPIVVNAMQLWNVILNFQGTKVIQLVRVFDDGQLVYCQTNDGNVELNKVLSKQDCEEILNGKEWVVLINEGKIGVIIEENKVIISSPRDESSVINFIVIKEIFPDAQQAFDIINQKIYGIK
jgi:hypothetical protein